jgi:hypothetical protein
MYGFLAALQGNEPYGFEMVSRSTAADFLVIRCDGNAGPIGRINFFASRRTCPSHIGKPRVADTALRKKDCNVEAEGFRHEVRPLRIRRHQGCGAVASIDEVAVDLEHGEVTVRGEPDERAAREAIVEAAYEVAGSV